MCAAEMTFGSVGALHLQSGTGALEVIHVFPAFHFVHAERDVGLGFVRTLLDICLAVRLHASKQSHPAENTHVRCVKERT